MVIDRISYIVAGSTFIFSLILFYEQNKDLIGSLAAALLATGLAWISYIILRWMYLAIRSNN